MMKQKYAFLDMYIRSCVFQCHKIGSLSSEIGNSGSIDLMIIKHQSPCRARITKIGLRRIRFIAVSTFSGLKKQVIRYSTIFWWKWRKSALTELRASQGSPKRTDTRCQATQNKPNKKPLVADILLSNDSDDENPLPHDEDDLPPSTSQIRYPKRSGKISLKKVDSKSTETLLKHTTQTTTDEEIDNSEDVDGFFPVPPTKRNVLERHQAKANWILAALVLPKRKIPKKKKPSLAHELEAIDPAEFFRSFTKSISSQTSSRKPKQGLIPKTRTEEKKKPSEKNVQITISPQTSPRKWKQKLSPENKNRRETVELNAEESVSKTQTRSIKTKKSPKLLHLMTRQKSSEMTKTLEMEMSKVDELTEIESPFQEAYLPWVDKYKPNSIKYLVGQNGEKSPMNKLLARPPPWLAQSDGTAFKAVMLSGPPEKCVRCEKQKALEAQTSEVIGCEQMDNYVNRSIARKISTSSEITHVLIMDEVDGMSGNDDRAGIAELIRMIKETLIPIICICNDRQSQKMRSLVNYCFDVRFQRPRVEQIRARLFTIACQECLKVGKEEIDEIIETAQHDVRQSIYNLQLLKSGKGGEKMQSKDAAVNPFEATRRLLNIDTPTWEKQQMFFVDPSVMPLFVHENYPFVQNSKMSLSERLCALRKAASSISEGDVIDRIIRTTGAWTLLNEQALFSSVLPTFYMNGYMKGMINFPSWLGKNSTSNKRQRLLRQLTTHAYLRTFVAVFPMVLDYIPVLRQNYCHSLLDKGNDGINDVVNLYKEYNLIRDDIESIAELAVWSGMKDPGAAIPTKIKAALTRTLNKEHIILPYALDTLVKGRKKLGGGFDLGLEVDEEGNLIGQIGDENDLEGSEGESDNDDNFTEVTKKKPVLQMKVKEHMVEKSKLMVVVSVGYVVDIELAKDDNKK
ncbi:Replication factor C subunit 1 [Dirofilaria immitis]|nr:Replication factor C subunit 1 [Dirofilaria immitis]